MSMYQLNKRQHALWRALCDAAEGPHEEPDQGWRDVYLDNVPIALLGIPPKSFPGMLSMLRGKGVYRPVDGLAWGSVNIAAPVSTY